MRFSGLLPVLRLQPSDSQRVHHHYQTFHRLLRFLKEPLNGLVFISANPAAATHKVCNFTLHCVPATRLLRIPSAEYTPALPRSPEYCSATGVRCIYTARVCTTGCRFSSLLFREPSADPTSLKKNESQSSIGNVLDKRQQRDVF